MQAFGGEEVKIVVKEPEELKLKIIKKGFSIRGFAREIDIPESYANQIMNATRNPGPDYAKRIVDFLGVEFDDIFFIT